MSDFRQEHITHAHGDKGITKIYNIQIFSRKICGQEKRKAA
jgi:hypothetical protein